MTAQPFQEASLVLSPETREEARQDIRQARDELLGLYRMAVEEYRYNVTLNWDRSKHYFTLNLAIIGAGLTLLRDPGVEALAPLAFWCGVTTCLVAIAALRKGHAYYRTSRDNKAALEQELGLRFRIQTTGGMRRAEPRTDATITTLMVGLFRILLTINAVGILHAYRTSLIDPPVMWAWRCLTGN